MNFEFNPFELNPAGAVAIKSITLFSNIDWFDVPDASIAGENVAIPLNTKTNLPPYQVFATGSSGASAPSMRLLTAAHIPPIQISQVIGLETALAKLPSGILSGNQAALTITNNAQGVYTITPNFGSIANRFAQGNDTRFPATLSAGVLRKTGSGGVGSSDTAAIAKTDFWDTTEFIASGGSAFKGLVPAPPFTAGTTKFLCEDKIWKVPPGSGTVTSLGIAVPSDILTVSSSTTNPITSTGTFTIAKANQASNTFWAGPATSGAPAAGPTFRALVYSDVSAFVGTGATSVAIGNDSRFPAIVTGLRKGNGVGSLDTAAAAKIDYWDASPFVGTGPSHAKGLVPDPGSGTSTTRFLNETGVWMDVVAATGTVTNASLATMLSKTIKANATALSDYPQDVSVQVAKSSALLNLESIVSIGDINVTMTGAYRIAATSASLSTNRAWTLPLANSVNAGYVLTVSDNFGGVSPIAAILVSRQGSDLLQGSGNPFKIDVKYGRASFVSDGVSKWSITGVSPSSRRRFLTSGTSYTTPTGVKALLVECVGAGGGGGGAKASAGTASVAAGGGGGGYAATYFETPKASYSYVVGAAGAAGVNTGANGGNGGDTTFDSPSACAATGGQGGSGDATAGAGVGFYGTGVAGNGSVGDTKTSGDAGGAGCRLGASGGASGNGGGSRFSGSVAGVLTTVSAAGSNNTGYGGGGSGAQSLSATGFAGGAGSQGIIIITEHY